MSHTPRPRMARTIAFDTLEGKTLLAAAVMAPAAVAPPPALVAPAQSFVDDIQVKKNDFRVDGGETSYDLTFVSGQYRFIHDYELEIETNRRNNNNLHAGAESITAVDAVVIFFDRLASRIGLQAGLTAAQQQKVQAAQNGNGDWEADYSIAREQYRHRGGTLTYKLNIDSGGYTFEQEYALKLKRANRLPIQGVTAVDSVGIFIDGLYTHIENFFDHQTDPL